MVHKHKLSLWWQSLLYRNPIAHASSLFIYGRTLSRPPPR